MKPTVAILSIGTVPVDEIRTVLTEHVVDEKITHISLLGNMSREEVSLEFAPDIGEEQHLALLSDNQLVNVGSNKVSLAMQNLVSLLDKLGYEVILLMNTMPLSGLKAQSAILLEPDRILPPLVASIVESHQMGVILPFPELIKYQQDKWRLLEKTPLYDVANPVDGSDEELLQAARQLIERGVTVFVLDYLVFMKRHQQLLEQHFDIPVILTNMLVARLASELLD
ncbi:AroM family protein [Klebsiella sp. BIGb0407]|uniref:AroM family protein n=1 Tax=Klebsiella sp. BIGb0407 TaxID=2940603 RepID=UPI002169249C|nr:AroM family protein [Klebsiella sp. BIGb0407]MCS3432375.1 protein AroM [Klebsiella sp. BIGb0407]